MHEGERIAATALALVGTPFRLHGRCAATGVDCIGLALLSLRGAGIGVAEPPPYRMRAGAAPMLAGWMRGAGFRAVGEVLPGELLPGDLMPGDLLFVRVSAFQPHLLVEAGDGVVHAHAALGRVVRSARPVEWPLLSCWRLDKEG